MDDFLRGLRRALAELCGTALVRFYAELKEVEFHTAGGRLNQCWVRRSAVGALVVLVFSAFRFRIGDGAMVSWGLDWYVVAGVLAIIALAPPTSALLLYMARKEDIDLG